MKRIIAVLMAALSVLILLVGCQKRQMTVSFDKAVSLAENFLTENGFETKKEKGDYQYGSQTKITAVKGEKKYTLTFYYYEGNEMPVNYEVETINLYDDSTQIYTKIDYDFFESLAEVLNDKDTNAKEIKKAIEDKRDYYDSGHPDEPDKEGYKMVKIYEQNLGEMRVLYRLRGDEGPCLEYIVVQGVCG